jgi:hypothetical protein
MPLPFNPAAQSSVSPPQIYVFAADGGSRDQNSRLWCTYPRLVGGSTTMPSFSWVTRKKRVVSMLLVVNVVSRKLAKAGLPALGSPYV